MSREPSLSDPPQEEAFVGDPRAEDAPAGEPEAPVTPPTTGAAARDRGRLIALGAMGVFVAVGVGLIALSSRRGGAPAPALALTTSDRAANTNADAAAVATNDAPDAGPPIVRPPAQWRVSSLKEDPNAEVSEGAFGKRGLVATLTEAGLSRPEIHRLAKAFEGVRRVDHPKDTDAFVLAKDKAKGVVLAFEYATSPLDVWQARVEDPAGAEPRFIVKKLELFVEHRRIAHGLLVGADLGKAITAAGFRPEIAMAVDDALEGHVDPGSIRAGVRLRVVATEDWVESAFVRVKVDAIEFVPKAGSPLRVYHYERDASVDGSSRRAPAPGFYDAKGKQPYRGQFRSPLPLARVTSRFNPKRMHPVLKVVMPHQGVDFGASAGTPVYASAAGTVITAGNGGPCGNMVEIDHGSGINTVYCHLKGFAQGLHSGEKVEARQHVGYVGQTGRVTGPHLHFGVKKHGVYIDPLALKMDGVRVLPPSDRDAFARRRSELDAVIDGVALPSAADVPEENEDKDLHAE
ncbi:MAG TPA: M23 family metallopeptidase [Labilithrix sp.]|jgi:murein DD-endopeptidase MepM/ murein hydrolase activator NlpD|nr:M23 family metallopeptidase [Labilithrix sp.]